ncbi:hypothetical protein GCM10007392_09710 [Saccharospirillum salsuginis]|uniref:Tetratricopeptide repeat-containing protein n=2 Tax=Saccharospirillum salsuginis TaxID=418750 RepID=A0A918K2E7_9GAMM|nr:hypothetical protein GCM10007392_09710 [Saccharospirillum salsuginis]
MTTMATSRLYQVLSEHSKLDPEVLDALQAELEDPSDGRALGELIVRRGLMSFYEMMSFALKHDLFQKTEAVLKRMAEARKHHQVIKPQQHVSRYKLSEDEKLKEEVTLPGRSLKLTIPRPNLGRYSAISTDEKQVVEMAVELVNIGQLQEAEMFLIDASEEFPNSVRVKVVLVWLYFMCQQYKLARDVCAKAQREHPSDINLVEYLGLLEQSLGKHLSAVNHYQRLTLLPKVKPVWYLLLGLSLEHAGLRQDAIINYRMYVNLGQQEELIHYVNQRLQVLVPQ